MTYTDRDLDRLRSYEKVHLRGVEEPSTPGEKIEALHRKDRNKGYMLIFNLLAILFFTYSYYFGITTLGDTIYVVLVIVFALNVALIFLQKKQIGELIEFYRNRG